MKKKGLLDETIVYHIYIIIVFININKCYSLVSIFWIRHTVFINVNKVINEESHISNFLRS